MIHASRPLAVVAVGLVALATACGGEVGSDIVGDEGTTSTSAAGPSVGEADGERSDDDGERGPPGPGFDVATLPVCGTDAYTTITNWTATDLGDGWDLWAGHTGVSTEPGTETPPRWALAEIDRDRVLEVVVLTESATPLPSATAGPDPETESMDSVRGVAGTVDVRTSRGGSSATYAEWAEDGSHHQAVSSMSVSGLADALEPLELSDGEVTDPTGRLVEIGHVPGHTSEGYRASLLEFRRLDSGGRHGLTLHVRIDERTAGASGIIPAVNSLHRLGDAVGEWIEVDGRDVLVDINGYTSVLEDGSSVNLRAYSPDSNPMGASGSDGEALDAVTAVLGNIRRTDAGDAQQLASLAPQIGSEDEPVVPYDFCSES